MLEELQAAARPHPTPLAHPAPLAHPTPFAHRSARRRRSRSSTCQSRGRGGGAASLVGGAVAGAAGAAGVVGVAAAAMVAVVAPRLARCVLAECSAALRLGQAAAHSRCHAPSQPRAAQTRWSARQLEAARSRSTTPSWQRISCNRVRGQG